MPRRDEVVEEARKMLGVRWRHQGRLPGMHKSAGVDCAGLVVKVAHHLGLSDFDILDYPRHADWSKFVGHFRDNMKEITRDELRPGDVICVRDGMFPCHCGIIGQDTQGRLTFIHAYAPKRMVVEEYYTGLWVTNTVGSFSYHGVED